MTVFAFLFRDGLVDADDADLYDEAEIPFTDDSFYISGSGWAPGYSLRRFQNMSFVITDNDSLLLQSVLQYSLSPHLDISLALTDASCPDA